MAWLEYNIHVRQIAPLENFIPTLSPVLVDLVKPFVKNHRNLFNHWHYLLEPDKCRPSIGNLYFYEIRVRFEGEEANLNSIKADLTTELKKHRELVIPEDEEKGSHEGCHGNRNSIYQGAASENFGRDWQSIMDILQMGSESAIEILRLGRGLVENNSLQMGRRLVRHPRYLHLPANQLIVEP